MLLTFPLFPDLDPLESESLLPDLLDLDPLESESLLPDFDPLLSSELSLLPDFELFQRREIDKQIVKELKCD